MRRKRLKKYILIILLLAAAVLAGAAYIAVITVPVTFQTTLRDEFEKALTKKIFIGSIRLDILKGLVLDGVVIYDKSRVCARAKEVSAFIIYSQVFWKRAIIPCIRVESPSILAERMADGTFSFKEIISKTYIPPKEVSIIIHGIKIRRGHVTFIDRRLDPAFRIDLDNLKADISFNLPVRVAYAISFDIAQRPKIPVEVKGEYSIPDKKSITTLTANGIRPDLLARYIGTIPFGFPGGLVDAVITVTSASGRADAHVMSRTRELQIQSGNIRAKLDSSIQADLRYDAATKRFEYSGFADIVSLDLEGLEALGPLKDIKGKARFDDTRLWCDPVEADVLGIHWKAKFNLANFAKPIIDIYASSDTKLGSFQKTICEACDVTFPVELAGDAKIDVAISIERDMPVKTNGSVRLRDATMRLGSGRYPVEHINGQARFTPQRLEWSSMKLAYRDRTFTTSGSMVNFASPGVRMAAASKDLSFDAVFNVNGSNIILTELNGKYLGTSFSASGSLDIRDPSGVAADLQGSAELNLEDLPAISGRSPGILKMKPAGLLNSEFIFKGNTKNLMDCVLRSKAKGLLISLYGVRLAEAAIDYAQEKGIGELKTFRANCYGGVLNAAGKVNYRFEGEPFAVSLDAQDIMLERLKMDTGFKNADVSGDIKVYANLTGILKDLSKLSGVGRLTITDGRLWQLDLFKGLGSTIFTSDFSSIVFSEGSCDFRISDRIFYADSVDLKGELMRLYGSGRLGFDNSISAVLRPEINENTMWPGTQRNIAMAIQRGTAIEISGTLKNPAFRNRTDVLAVVGGVAGALLKQE